MSSTTSTPGRAAQVLLEQLDLVWLFADQHVLPQIDSELAAWQPSGNTLTVRSSGEGWVADWPDEEVTPLPEPTVGWLLWHIEWWWGNTVRACQGKDPIGPGDHLWSGSVTGVRDAKATWEQVLRTTRSTPWCRV